MIKYGLIGERLSHSYSEAIHHFLGNGDYSLKEVAPSDINNFFENPEFLGINVTIPYKQTVMPYCELSEDARNIGSVNTVINEGGKLLGYNTDYPGFLYMAKRAGIGFNNKKVIVLGSGGASKTACYAAKKGGASEIAVISRNGESSYQNISRHYNCDIIINTTPVGMYPNNHCLSLDISPFTKLAGVLDVVYNPLKTRLIVSAEEMGIKCCGGLPMLAAQAVYAHRLFFPGSIDSNDTDIIKDVIKMLEKQYRNIILIGMPGSGKTTIGNEAALKLGLKHIDTDQVIEEKYGMHPSKIITEQGEDYFRNIEGQIISDICKNTGQVISTGGGSVLLNDNRVCLKQNGFIVFLNRPLDRLETAGRPLSAHKAAIEAMFEKRYPIYTKLCNRQIDIGIDLKENVNKLLEIIK